MRNSNLSLMLFSLFLSFLFIACDNKEEILIDSEQEEILDINEATEKPSLNYLALGDSYTIGQSVAIRDRWSYQLREQLKKDSIQITKVDFIAKTGWTTNNLLSAIKNTDLDLTAYNLVSLLIGVNNQYQGKPFALFEAEFVLLLNQAIEIAGGKERVFVVSIPDYGITPIGSGNSENIAREIDQYNAYSKKICDEQQIPFIDITAISRALGSSEGALAPDNLHPSGSQYTKWLEEILPAVLSLLGE